MYLYTANAIVFYLRLRRIDGIHLRFKHIHKTHKFDVVQLLTLIDRSMTTQLSQTRAFKFAHCADEFKAPDSSTPAHIKAERQCEEENRKWQPISRQLN